MPRQIARMRATPPQPDPFPPFDPQARLAAVTQQADAVAGTLRVARALGLSHRPVDLAGLDHMVGRLCAQALDLPPEQGRAIRVRLITLDRDLADLAGVLAPP